MIGRVIVTSVIWIFSMYGLTTIVNRMAMTTINLFPPESEMAAIYPYGETVFMPDLQAFMLGLLMMALVLGATISTIAIWRNAPSNSEAKAQEARAQAEKTKRREYYTPNDPQQQARLMRLVESLNDDDIAYLEARSLADDGELYMPR